MKKALITAYVLVALVTFGHAWHRIDPVFQPTGKDGVLMCSLASAALWPLYWSQFAWSKTP